MLLKLLKLNANDAIISGATAISSSGSVTLRKICQPRAPSTCAASVSSAGIDWSAPIETRKKYGNVSQMLTRITRDPAPSTGRTATAMSTCWNVLLMTPKSSFRSPFQTSSDRKPGIAYGMISDDR